jgi:heme exporter protein B
MAAPAFWKASLAILGKDARAERRTKEVLNTSLLFALIVLVVFSFAFEPTSEEARRISGGLLWVAITFAGVLALNRSFARELPNDALMGLLAAPVSPAAIYLGKVLANAAFMFLIELLVLPLFAVFYNVALLEHAAPLAAILILGTWGFAVLGTILAAMTVTVRTRELMLPVLLFPLLAPLLIAMVEATTAVLAGEPWRSYQLWMKTMVAFDVIFTVASLLLVEYVLEGG